MAELDVTEIAGSSILTPGSGVKAMYADSADHRLRSKDASGVVRNIDPFVNYSVAQQQPAAATRTYITGSQVALPRAGVFQIGTIIRWRFNMTKTAAGTAASTIDIAFGTAGTTADTARCSFTKPAGTAAADEATCEVVAVVRGPLTTACVVAGKFTLGHNLAATGHATIPWVDVLAISAGFDITTPTFVGLCLTSGASDAINIEQVFTEVFNL